MDETEEKKELALANAMEQNHTHARSPMAKEKRRLQRASHVGDGGRAVPPGRWGAWGNSVAAAATGAAIRHQGCEGSAPRGESTGWAGGRW
jgi:hypothetical protein